MKKENINNIVDCLVEVGMLAKAPRSGFFFLGSGEQSVAEHVNRTAYIGFVLASIANDIDASKVLKMCIFHDLAEARVSDLNYVHQKYTESKEAKLAKDADTLEFLLSLKEQVDIGNERAKTWTPPLLKRLLTDEAKELAKVIVETDSDRWWYGNKNDDWWVSRGKER